MKEFIREFKKLGRHDANLAGGKGASLGEMTQAGIPVPPGYVILADAFDHFCEETDLNIEINAILATVDIHTMHTIENASEKIQALIHNAEMPKDIADLISKHFAELGTEYVAVRSSATAEDSSAAAWAGQLDSYLNTTEKELLKNVQRCWASLFTPRAIFYRFEKGLDTQKISVAVVVQKMVNSEKSGIAFSVHPVTEDYNQIIVEAGFGLGEAIVSGSVTPDSYVISKSPFDILDINISEQSRALYRIASDAPTTPEHGRNEWKELGEKGKEQVLSKEDILELSKIILTIENHYKFPCDIEWAYEKNTFYIVQSRPITTLRNNIVQEVVSYEKYISRDFSIPMLELWYQSEAQSNLPYIEKQPYQPYIVFERIHGTVNSYYSLDGMKWTTQNIVKTIKENPQFLNLLESELSNGLGKIQSIYENPKPLDRNTLLIFIQDFQKVVSWAVLMWLLCGMEKSELEGIDISKIQLLRESTDKLSSGTDIVIRLSLKNIYPELEEDSAMLTLEEIKNNTIPSREELIKRDNGFFFTDAKLFVGAIQNEIEEKFTIQIVKENVVASEIIHGQIGFKGKVRGKVKLVIGHKHIPLIQEGEVLVSPMTMPDFLPAMEKAVAFITDEGGITCHAAIVSRELKKPCIVGTKFATQILKDGDLVEVDADNGIVRILEKK